MFINRFKKAVGPLRLLSTLLLFGTLCDEFGTPLSAIEIAGPNPDGPFPTASYLSLKQDILIEADLWRDIPEILAANYAFEGIIGIAPLNEQRVIAVGGTWMDLPPEIAERASTRAFTSAASVPGSAATYGFPVHNADAMPIVFSWPVLPSTVDPTDFEIHLNDGTILHPEAASIFPNFEYNERNTVVVFGEFGNRLPPSDPNAIYIVKTVIVADDTPLMLVGPNGPVSAVGLEKASGHSYVEGGGPTLAGAKLNHMSTAGEGGPAAFAAQLPNDGRTLYGDDAQYRLRILTTGGFSPDGVSSVFPTDFQTYFRLHVLDGDSTILLTETGVPYQVSGGTIEIVGLAELGLPDVDAAGNPIAPYDLAYQEDHDNYIDIILKGDEAAMRQVTHVEIPATGDYLPFYNPGGPGNNPTPGVRYTKPGPPTLQPVTIALDDPMWVTYLPASILSIRQTEAGIQLTWPSGVDGFVLQETETLSPPAWTPINTEPETIDNNHSIFITNPVDSSFYRLVK